MTTPYRPTEVETDVADSSFDVVSKVDRQEVDNALNQAAKEIANRFDFRNTGASIEWSGEESIVITADTEDRVKAALDVFKEKLIRRDLSLKSLETGEPTQSGKVYKASARRMRRRSRSSSVTKAPRA